MLLLCYLQNAMLLFCYLRNAKDIHVVKTRACIENGVKFFSEKDPMAAGSAIDIHKQVNLRNISK